MGLKRWGMVLFGVGLLVGGLAALFGVNVAGTTVGCPAGRASTYAFRGFAWEYATIAYSDGCTTHLLNPGISVGIVLALVGVAVGGTGIAASRRTGR